MTRHGSDDARRGTPRLHNAARRRGGLPARGARAAAEAGRGQRAEAQQARPVQEARLAFLILGLNLLLLLGCRLRFPRSRRRYWSRNVGAFVVLLFGQSKPEFRSLNQSGPHFL